MAVRGNIFPNTFKMFCILYLLVFVRAMKVSEFFFIVMWIYRISRLVSLNFNLIIILHNFYQHNQYKPEKSVSNNIKIRKYALWPTLLCLAALEVIPCYMQLPLLVPLPFPSSGIKRRVGYYRPIFILTFRRSWLPPSLVSSKRVFFPNTFKME
jgi:hypothetical protein